MSEDTKSESKSLITVLPDTFYMTGEALAKEKEGFNTDGAVIQEKRGNTWVDITQVELNAMPKIVRESKDVRYVFQFNWAIPNDLSPEAIGEVNRWYATNLGEEHTFYTLATNPQGLKLSCNNAARDLRRPESMGRGVGAKVTRVTMKLSNDILDGKFGGDEEYNTFLKLKGDARKEWLVELAKKNGLL